jgi:hypothetical protein
MSIVLFINPEPDPVPNVRIRIQPKRSGSDRIRILNTAAYTIVYDKIHAWAKRILL